MWSPRHRGLAGRASLGSLRVAAAPDIFGSCDERFVPVREALADNFRERGELGAAVAVSVDGRPVVDIWAGWSDVARTRLWQRDTLVGRLLRRQGDGGALRADPG